MRQQFMTIISVSKISPLLLFYYLVICLFFYYLLICLLFYYCYLLNACYLFVSCSFLLLNICIMHLALFKKTLKFNSIKFRRAILNNIFFIFSLKFSSRSTFQNICKFNFCVKQIDTLNFKTIKTKYHDLHYRHSTYKFTLAASCIYEIRFEPIFYLNFYAGLRDLGILNRSCSRAEYLWVPYPSHSTSLVPSTLFVR